jgi:hypothetical protein
LISSWKEEARRELMELRGSSSAWSYRRAHVASAEPTVLACLGMLASGDQATIDSDMRTAEQGAGWLAAIQRPDGSVPVVDGLPSPGWPTPYALLLWSNRPGYDLARRRGRSWLLECKGATQPRANVGDNIVGHDPSLVGWPWVDGTHSWLEPTALSLLALNREGLGQHPRVSAGIELVRDRALVRGGWSCGGKSAFGNEQRPQPTATGLALLALAARGDRSAAVARGVAYLRATLADIRAAVSVGWGILGLRAHDALPVESETWLREAHARCTGRPDAAMGLALLLLAASEPALRLILTPIDASST